MRSNEKNTAPEAYRTTFEKLSNKWGLTFNDERIIVPNELRKKLLETLHFEHAGSTKMAAEAKIFWCPNIQKEIEEKSKNCAACMASKISKTETRIRETKNTNGTRTRKSKNNTIENEGTRRSNREKRQSNRYGVVTYTKFLGVIFKTKLLHVKDGTSEKSPRNR